MKIIYNKNIIKNDSFIQNSVKPYNKYVDDKNQNIFSNKKK